MQHFLTGCLQKEEKHRFSWNDIYNHKLFANRFSKYIQFKKDLVDKANFIVTDLRRYVQSHRIDLNDLFDELDMSKNRVLTIKE